MVGTGSEMNGGAVITNHDQKLKIDHVFGDAVMPKFAVLNPKFTFSSVSYTHLDVYKRQVLHL